MTDSTAQAAKPVSARSGRQARDRADAPPFPISPEGEASMGRQQQIYYHAARLFVEKGFAATSMADIAEAVGITKAGIYHFVADKDQLLFTLMKWGMDVLDRDVTTPARAVADPLARLDFIVRRHLENIGRGNGDTGNPFTLLLDEPAGLTPEHRAEIMARKRTYYELVRDTLRDLRADGRLHPIDPSIAAFSLLGMIVWLARWHREGGRASLESVVDQVTGMILRSVVRPEALPG